MPAKNIIKDYAEGAYYHIYNRGVEKKPIFRDDQDCHVFLRYIKLYLSSKKTIEELGITELKARRFANLNLENDVDLLCFALMPNHFHLQVKNKSIHGIKTFMQRLTTAYVMYFNRKYKRVGPLFQNIYKASLITNDSYMLHLSRYIHNNSNRLKNKKIRYDNYSSYQYYVGDRQAEWLKTEMITSYFQNSVEPQNFASSYKKFVEMDISDSIAVLQNQKIILENECV